ncbi:UvrY/SirA/GacA family response regulator transcription factor [Ferrimonas balearica]|uniref:UvrY/SirA/GacA family response regulator transcription factor n=1 Tax=Ferrimonas balearica TaxID=44012 RepID=UPI001C996193|nr:UvrY/SirA/GacA family response regulator transcription factor [Ferrimonas balearica]MBY5991892.1 UvrY/SirA/GacA family response regulator transcription factor [Ferrimonas balearica]
MINVLLVDDHALVRTGISRILEDERGIKVVGEAEDGEQAVNWCRKNDADVVLMDMSMPGIGGLEATRKILRYNPDARIIILTVYTEEPIPSKVMAAGAAGFLTKNAPPADMVQAIRVVASGQRYIAPEIAQQMALKPFNPERNPFDDLSERELQITMMVTSGQKVSDISEQLNLSPKTVNSYRYRLFEKLKISGDVELTRLAIRYGMVDSEKI